MLFKIWKCNGRRRTHRPFCVILKISGTILAAVGIACFAVYFFKSDSDFALLGMSSMASAAAGFYMANHVQQ